MRTPLLATVLLSGCAASSTARLPTQPQVAETAFCEQLMAEQTALAARTAETAPRVPPTDALDSSNRVARRMCEGLVRQTPNGFASN